MIQLYGTSDDLVEIRGDIQEELNVYGPIDILIGWDRTTSNQPRGVIVQMAYAPEGMGAVWVAGLAPIDENIRSPNRYKSDTMSDRFPIGSCPTTSFVGLRDQPELAGQQAYAAELAVRTRRYVPHRTARTQRCQP